MHTYSSYHIIFFHQIIMNIFNIIKCNSIITYTEIINITSKPSFFILSVDQSLEILPKHNGLATISESFALTFIISVPLTNKQLFVQLWCKLRQNLFFVTVKLIEYIFSAVRVLSNPCVGPLPRTNISFFLLSICIEEPMSARKINTF